MKKRKDDSMRWTSEISPLVKEVELRKNPVVIRVNKFDEDAAKKFDLEVTQAHNTGQKVIPVVIDSYGGQVYSLMAMISTIKHSEKPIATIVEGKAMSCGAILFSCGQDGMRYMDTHATLMIHDVSSMKHGKVEEIKSSVAQTDKLNEIVYTLMARNCGKADDYFMKMVDQKKHADWYLDAEEAMRHNLANHLRVPKLNIRVDVTIDFE